MPDSSPSLELLRRMGFNIPQSGLIDKNRQTQLALKAQQNDPAWKRYGRESIDGLVNLVKGTLGIDPDPNESSTGYAANAASQLTQAGLPFLAISKGNPVFHGTKKVFEKFNPEVYDTGDTLGALTHFASQPEYADMYATGNAKSGPGIKPNIIKAVPDAKNVLDLTPDDLNWDDISQMVGSLPDKSKEDIIKTYKIMRAGSSGSKKLAQELLVSGLYRELNDRKVLSNSPFDAIHYRDQGHNSWAVPETTPINTPWGAPLNDPGKPIKVIRSDKSGGGVSIPSDDRWANTPMNLPERPMPEKHKGDWWKWNPYKKYSASEIDDMYFDNVINADTKNWLYKNNLLKQSPSNPLALYGKENK